MPKKIPAPKLQNLTKTQLQEHIQVLSSVLVDRAGLAARAGMQYGTDRNLYKALGYKTEENLDFTDYLAYYSRQDIANAIIQRPVGATWRGGVQLLESDDDKETKLEKAWDELYDQHNLLSKFARLDRLTGIGQYGVLWLGLSDVKTKEDSISPVTGKDLTLLYVKPLSEGSAVIDSWEENPGNERFGLPTIYNIAIKNPGSTNRQTGTTETRVHYSRVIHVASGLLESETEGTPRLKSIFNRLMDLDKVVGGSAEMFWRGARPGYQGIVDKDYGSVDTTGLQDQFDEYEHNLRRYMINAGIEMKSLDQQIADPKSQVDVIIQMISAAKGIPKRILTGSERGELASSQDEKAWKELIQDRRDEFSGPIIVRQTVDRCIEYGVLPPAGEDGYSVQWSDLWAPSEKEKAEVGKIRADAVKAYASDPVAQDIMPPEAFLRLFLGLSDEQIAQVNEIKKQEVIDEGNDFVDEDGGEQ